VGGRIRAAEVTLTRREAARKGRLTGGPGLVATLQFFISFEYFQIDSH
jgi:hypothetical protein